MKLATWVLLAGGLVLITHAVRAEDGAGERWWSHVRYLADDQLEGRETGSEGHRKAAAYVAAEFAKAGLEPAGTQGFFQPVPFRTKTIDEAHTHLSLERAGGTETLTLGEDAIVSLRVDPAASVSAGQVFAGYGLSIPEAGYDDFQGLDVRGKVVVYLSGPPPSVPGPLAAHMQSARERTAVLNRLGAIGLAAIPNPKHMDIPWERVALNRLLPAMSLADPTLDDGQGQQIAITINPARADKWFASSGHDFREVLEADDAGKPLPHFTLTPTLHTKVSVARTDVQSQNVAAVLRGTDPALKDEYVVLTAHLDHLGVGKPINGDPIYNGAMDNAAGVATLLDVAASLKEAKIRLRRSVLFVAVTGEEKGLLGSRFFATFPTVEPKKIVANLNVDMFLPLFPLKKLAVFGLVESDLGADAVASAKVVGVTAVADPEPKRNLFIRSDQYSFIRQGVPALAFKVGFDAGSPEEKIAKAWLKECYHAPSDDLNQPVDKPAAAAFNALIANLVERVANRESRPRWNESSFFKRFAK